MYHVLAGLKTFC